MKISGLRRWAVLVAASAMVLAGGIAVAVPAGATETSRQTKLALASSGPLDGCYWEAQDPSYRSSSNQIRFRGFVECPGNQLEITITVAILINTGSGERRYNQGVETYTDTNYAPITLFHPCTGAGGSVETYRTSIHVKIYDYDVQLGEVSTESNGRLTHDCSSI